MSKQDIVNYVMETPHNTNRAVLEGLIDSLNEEQPKIQSDWTQANPEAEDYIKNKPGAYTALEPVNTATYNCNFTKKEGNGWFWGNGSGVLKKEDAGGGDYKVVFPLTYDDTYDISFNDKIYHNVKVRGYTIGPASSPSPGLGDPNLIEYPFFINYPVGFLPPYDEVGILSSLEGKYTLSMGKIEEVTHKIPLKYIDIDTSNLSVASATKVDATLPPAAPDTSDAPAVPAVKSDGVTLVEVFNDTSDEVNRYIRLYNSVAEDEFQVKNYSSRCLAYLSAEKLEFRDADGARRAVFGPDYIAFAPSSSYYNKLTIVDGVDGGAPTIKVEKINGTLE